MLGIILFGVVVVGFVSFAVYVVRNDKGVEEYETYLRNEYRNYAHPTTETIQVLNR